MTLLEATLIIALDVEVNSRRCVCNFLVMRFFKFCNKTTTHRVRNSESGRRYCSFVVQKNLRGGSGVGLF